MKLCDLPRDLVLYLADLVPNEAPRLARANKDLWSRFHEDLLLFKPALMRAQRKDLGILINHAPRLWRQWPSLQTQIPRRIAGCAVVFAAKGPWLVYATEESLHILAEGQELETLPIARVQALALLGDTCVAATHNNVLCIRLHGLVVSSLLLKNVEGTRWKLALATEHMLLGVGQNTEDHSQALFIWRELLPTELDISETYAQQVWSMAASEAWLAVGFSGGIVQNTSLVQGNAFRFRAHGDDDVTAVEFTADPCIMVTSDETQLRIWNLSSGKPFCTAQINLDYDYFCVAPSYILIATPVRIIRVSLEGREEDTLPFSGTRTYCTHVQAAHGTVYVGGYGEELLCIKDR